ncbi:MAG: OadG family protein [Cyclobacteriaceae bacterium]|nr:OadG family protein [Cyclobacteriaceae bacterium]
MTEEIQIGLTIMTVGMITVFSILGLVVLGGKLMIIIINKLAKEVSSSKSNVPQIVTQQIDKTKISVLTSAVVAFTKGKGKIIKIRKL